MLEYFDSHCHIPAVIPKNIGMFVCATKQAEWNKIIQIAHNNASIFPAIGIHPWFISNIDKDFYQKFEQIIQQQPELMVGEIGLDKNYPQFDLQQELFLFQFNIARIYNRPVIIHCIKAWDILLNIFKQNHLPPKILLHSCNASTEIITHLSKNSNIFFSYSIKILKYNSNNDVSRINATPNEQLLIETDSNYQNNDFNLLPNLIHHIANIKIETIPNMSNTIYKNNLRFITNV